MFLIVRNLQQWTVRFFERGDDPGDQAIASPRERADLTVNCDAAYEQPLTRRTTLLVIHEHEPIGCTCQIAVLKTLPNIGGVEFASDIVGQILHMSAEI